MLPASLHLDTDAYPQRNSASFRTWQHGRRPPVCRSHLMSFPHGAFTAELLRCLGSDDDDDTDLPVFEGTATKRQRLPPSQTSQPAFIAPTECLTSQWGVDFSQHLSQSQLADEIAGCLDDAASFDGFASIFPPVDTPLRPAGTVSPLSSGLARDVHRHYAQEQAPQRRVPPRVHRIRCH